MNRHGRPESLKSRDRTHRAGLVAFLAVLTVVAWAEVTPSASSVSVAAPTVAADDGDVVAGRSGATTTVRVRMSRRGRKLGSRRARAAATIFSPGVTTTFSIVLRTDRGRRAR